MADSNYFNTPAGISEVLWRDGYFAAARLIERLQSTVSRNAEKEYLKHFAAESSLDESVCCNQLRSLWTAYCLHHDLSVDTGGYDADLLDLWGSVEGNQQKTADWSNFNSFDHFMCQMLV